MSKLFGEIIKCDEKVNYSQDGIKVEIYIPDQDLQEINNYLSPLVEPKYEGKKKKRL